MISISDREILVLITSVTLFLMIFVDLRIDDYRAIDFHGEQDMET